MPLEICVSTTLSRGIGGRDDKVTSSVLHKESLLHSTLFLLVSHDPVVPGQ
jgi:hypothetical protein